MRKYLKLVALSVLIANILSGCIIWPWWDEGGGHHHGHHGGYEHEGGHRR